MRSGAFFFFLFLNFLVGLPRPAAAAPVSARGEFCLQTFNVYGPAYASRTAERIRRAGEFLRSEGCDFLQFQELWKRPHFALLEEALGSAGWRGAWADDQRRDRFLTGLGTFAKGTALEVRSELYRVNNGGGLLDRGRSLGGVQKGFTLAEARAGALTLLLVNTHTHPTDKATRVAQLLQLAESLLDDAYAAELPVLFTADLNATPGGIEYAILKNLLLLRDAYVEANGAYGKECTYCAANPYSWSRRDRVIDFTLFRSGVGIDLRARAARFNLDGNGDPLSDHRGVRSEIEWSSRADEALPPDATAVTNRRRDAEATLQIALGLLERARDDRFLEAIHWAHSFAQRLRENRLNAAEERLFRTP